jgi:hypothetical protein
MEAVTGVAVMVGGSGWKEIPDLVFKGCALRLAKLEVIEQ